MPRSKLLFLVTEDRYFVSHRLPMARAARDAGFDVHVGTQISTYDDAIVAEGFTLHSLPWDRKSRSLVTYVREIWAVRALLRQIRPDLVHHVALKPVIFGLIASTGWNIGKVNFIAGLGSGFIGKGLKARLVKTALTFVLGTLLNRKRSVTIIQNEDDRQALIAIGVKPETLTLVAGSGVDTDVLLPLPEPTGPITVGIATRMLDDKGVRPLVKAQALLHAKGLDIRLLLAGDSDPGNRSSISEIELRGFATQPGVEWLGHVKNIKALWERCHIATLPSRREGLPKALLEAAAFGKSIVATDVPGCREIAIAGENALLVPVDDADALADAIETLAKSADLRATFGARGRKMVEEKFSSFAIGRQMVEIYRLLLAKPIDDTDQPV